MESKPIFLNAPQIIGPLEDIDVRKLTARRLPANPFVGLRSFERTEEVLFFGRREQTKQMLSILHASRFMAVVGSSGSGKSSLIRAGLIPNLEAGFLAGSIDRWSIATMKPGDSPLRNLAVALLSAFEQQANAVEVERFVEEIRLLGLSAIIGFLQEQMRSSVTNVLLLVDQFEEIFRFGSYDEDIGKTEPESFLEQLKRETRRGEAADLVSIMLGLSDQELFPVHVVMTMRSDFLGDCDAFYGLPEAMNRSQYLVPRLTSQQRKETIENPIRLYSSTITPRLLDTVLNDMEDERDQLPIMQHAMMRTWEKWETQREGPVDLPHYQQAGTIKGALSIDANNALEGMSQQELTITERLFQTLTETDGKGRRLRRPGRLSEIIEITGTSKQPVLDLIERFRSHNRSFLTLSQDPQTGDPLVDISHESLIRQWEKLRNWVDDEVKSKELYLRLAGDAVRHRDKEAPLWGDPALQLALNWWTERRPNEAWARRYHKEYRLARRFLVRSRMNRKDEERKAREESQKAQQYAEEKQRQAEALAAARQGELLVAQKLSEQQASAVRRSRIFVLVLLVFSLIIGLAALLALRAQAQARQNEERALKNEEIAKDARAQIEIHRDALELANRTLLEEKEKLEKAKKDAVEAQRQAEIASAKAEGERINAVNALKKADLTAAADAENWLGTKGMRAATIEPDPQRKAEMLKEALKSYMTAIDKYKKLGNLDTAASVHIEAAEALFESVEDDEGESDDAPKEQETTPIKSDWVSAQLLKEEVDPAKRFLGLELEISEKQALDHYGKAINIYRQLAQSKISKGGTGISEIYNNSAAAFLDVGLLLSPSYNEYEEDSFDEGESDNESDALVQASIYSFCAALDDYQRAGNFEGQIESLDNIAIRLTRETLDEGENASAATSPTLAGCDGHPAEAITYYEQTIPLYRRFIEQSSKYPEKTKMLRDEQIDSLLNVAGIYYGRKDEKRASARVDEAASVDLESTASKLVLLGHQESGARGFWYFLQAVEKYHAAGKPKEEADALVLIGNRHKILVNNAFPDDEKLKEYQKAIEFFQRALPLYGDASGEKAKVWMYIGSAHDLMNKGEESFAAYQNALNAARLAKDKKEQGRALYVIGRYQEKKSLKQQAIESYTSAAQLSQESKDSINFYNAKSALERLQKSDNPSPTPSPSPSPTPSPTVTPAAEPTRPSTGAEIIVPTITGAKRMFAQLLVTLLI